MKSLSASIIVVAGVGCLHVASEFPKGEVATLLVIIGIVIVGLGMFGWFRTPSNQP